MTHIRVDVGIDPYAEILKLMILPGGEGFGERIATSAAGLLAMTYDIRWLSE